MYLCLISVVTLCVFLAMKTRAVPLELNVDHNLSSSQSDLPKAKQIFHDVRRVHYRHEPPQYMLDLYNQIANSNEKSLLPYGATMARGVIEKDGDANRFIFSFSAIPPNETFLEAEFQFHHHQLEAQARNLLGNRKIYKLKIEASVAMRPSEISPQVVSSHASGRSIFKVGSTVRRARATGHSSIEFVVRAESMEGTRLPFVVHHGVRGSKAPLLVLFSGNADASSPEGLLSSLKSNKETTPTRIKRSLGDNAIDEERETQDLGLEYSPVATCHLTSLYVDFEEIHWDWIVYPVGYSANQCSGTCSIPFDHRNPTNHAVIRSLLLSASPEQSAEQPSCVPTSYNSLALLYYDEEESVILKRFRHMIATECGCR